MAIKILISVGIGYLFGCFSTGYFVGKLFHVDIQHHGSGNIGSTNALRTMGLKGGLLTLFGDVTKTILAILIVSRIFRGDGAAVKLWQLTTALGVILGHNYPFWLHFHGGKGIAAIGGMLLCFDWRMTLIGIVAFLLPIILTRYVSLGSILVSFTLPLGIVLFYRDSPVFFPMLVVTILILLLALIQHRTNIARLLSGTENKLGEREA